LLGKQPGFWAPLSGKESKPTGKPLPLEFFHLNNCEKRFHNPFSPSSYLTIDDNVPQNSDIKKAYV